MINDLQNYEQLFLLIIIFIKVEVFRLMKPSVSV